MTAPAFLKISLIFFIRQFIIFKRLLGSLWSGYRCAVNPSHPLRTLVHLHSNTLRPSLTAIMKALLPVTLLAALAAAETDYDHRPPRARLQKHLRNRHLVRPREPRDLPGRRLRRRPHPGLRASRGVRCMRAPRQSRQVFRVRIRRGRRLRLSDGLYMEGRRDELDGCVGGGAV